MDPMGNPRETTPGSPRETTPETKGSETTGTPRSTTPIDIILLSPGINDNSYLSRLTEIMTTERTNLNKKSVTKIRKLPKKIKRLKYLTPNNHIHMKNNQTMIQYKVEPYLINLIERRNSSQ